MGKSDEIILALEDGGGIVDVEETSDLRYAIPVSYPGESSREPRRRKPHTSDFTAEPADDVLPGLIRGVGDILTVGNVHHLIPAIRKNLSPRAVRRAADKLNRIAKEME